MTEVDRIEAALNGPVNSWLNGEEQLLFQRLVRIARSAEVATAAEKTVVPGVDEYQRQVQKARERATLASIGYLVPESMIGRVFVGNQFEQPSVSGVIGVLGVNLAAETNGPIE